MVEEIQEYEHRERDDDFSDKSKPKPKPKPADSESVRDITKQVFGSLGLPFSPDTNNLVHMSMPTASTFRVIDESRFAFGTSNPLQFKDATNHVGRIGIFAVKKGDLERAIILVVPDGTTPKEVLVVISAKFVQNADFYKKLGGGDPLSPKVILFTLNSHLKDNHKWAAQMMASSKTMAMVYIVRNLAGKKDSELGPLVTDGAFFRKCLVEMAALTKGGFSFDAVSAMSFSIGINDFNPFVTAISKHVNVTRIVNIDPQHAAHAVRPKGAAVREFLSGETGIGSGFEFIPEPRWANEDEFVAKHKSGVLKTKQGRLSYFHDICMANYLLRLALEKS